MICSLCSSCLQVVYNISAVLTKKRQPKRGQSKKTAKRRGRVHDDMCLDTSVRRSSRQRKLVYGTCDQKMLDTVLYLDGVPVFTNEDRPRKRKANKVDPVDVRDQVVVIP